MPSSRTAPRKAPAKAAAKKPTAKEASAKKASAKKRVPAKGSAPAKKSQAKSAPAKKTAPAKKSTAKKSTAKESAAKKSAPVTKAPARTSPPRKASTEQAPAPSPATAKQGAPAKSPSAQKSSWARPQTPAKRPAKEGAAGPKKSPYGVKFLAQQEKALHEERSTYTRQFTNLRAEAAALVADFESGDVQFDEESGEGDTINIERERDLALSEQARQAIDEIDRALAKIADGSYGVCEVSGDPIPPERLEAIPWARERVEYKTGGLGRR